MGIQEVKPLMGVALGSKDAPVGRQELLEHGHLKHAPEEIAFQYGQFAVADTREDDDRGVDGRHGGGAFQDSLGQLAQYTSGASHRPRPADSPS